MAVSNFMIRIILILIAVVVLIVLITHYNQNKKKYVADEARPIIPQLEKYEEPQIVQPRPKPADSLPVPTPQPSGNSTSSINEVRPSESLANEDYKAVDFSTESKLPADCFPRDRNTVEDLLPKDAANSTWAQVNPAGQGDVKDQNFLNAGFHIGMNTVGQTLRNPNYQLRSEPPNPKMQVSPWNQSTIEFDSSRRMFEVGDC
jgi:hypothetical protein